MYCAPKSSIAGIAMALLCTTGSALAQIGKASSPIVVGDTVDAKEQRQMGLVTVNNGCSATLLNRYWVLTASHCVTTDKTAGGPTRPLAQQAVSATWSTQRPVVTQVVRYWGSNGLDVALLLLGSNDFGPVDRKLIYHSVVDDSMTLRHYGRGSSGYASGSGTAAVAAPLPGTYRKADFAASDASSTSIKVLPNSAGQIAIGGDSGGPFYTLGANGQAIAIASVLSTCTVTRYVDNKPKIWAWATGISSCQSAALATIRDDINRVISAAPTDPQAAKGRVNEIPVASKLPAPGKLEAAATREPHSAADLPQPTAACPAGLVTRLARPTDLVCVTPLARGRTSRENATAARYVDPNGAYGPNSCLAGFVWREAFVGDVVCVTPQVRTIVKHENTAQLARRQPPERPAPLILLTPAPAPPVATTSPSAMPQSGLQRSGSLTP